MSASGTAPAQARRRNVNSVALGALVDGQLGVLVNPWLGDTASDKVKSLAITGQDRSPLAPGLTTVIVRRLNTAIVQQRLKPIKWRNLFCFNS